MRFLCLLSGLLLVSLNGAMAQTPKLDLSPLLRVPNLRPSLTDAEVEAKFTPWVQRVKIVAPGLHADFAILYDAHRAVLGARLPKVTKLTLYSLYPIDSARLDKHLKEEQKHIRELPLFHDYPVLGSVVLENADEANRWTDFLRDQILPGDFVACDFMPRHGFRLTTPQGDVDVVMCFACGQLELQGASFRPALNPVFAPAVRDQVNQLFDKLKVERDLEKKE